MRKIALLLLCLLVSLTNGCQWKKCSGCQCGQVIRNESVQRNLDLVDFMVITEVDNVVISSKDLETALSCMNDIIAKQVNKKDKIGFVIHDIRCEDVSPDPFARSKQETSCTQREKVCLFKYSDRVSILEIVSTLAVEYGYCWSVKDGGLFFSNRQVK